jgi:hypothetical protein
MHRPTKDILRIAGCLIVATVLIVGGCAWLVGCSASNGGPTDPSSFHAEHVEETHPDGTVIVRDTVIHTGPQNEKTSGAYKWDAHAKQFSHGASTASPFDWSFDNIDGTWLFIVGAVLIGGGAFAMWHGKAALAIPLFIGGGAAFVIPFVQESLRIIVLVGGLGVLIVGGAYAVCRYILKLKWFETATGPEAQAKMLAKGDKAGAAAAAYASTAAKTKNPEAAKAVAKTVSEQP